MRDRGGWKRWKPKQFLKAGHGTRTQTPKQGIAPLYSMQCRKNSFCSRAVVSEEAWWHPEKTWQESTNFTKDTKFVWLVWLAHNAKHTINTNIVKLVKLKQDTKTAFSTKFACYDGSSKSHQESPLWTSSCSFRASLLWYSNCKTCLALSWWPDGESIFVSNIIFFS